MDLMRRLVYGPRWREEYFSTAVQHVEDEEQGIIEGLFVASQAELDAWDKEFLTPSDWPAIDWKFLHPLSLLELEAAITGRPFEDLIDDASLDPVWVGSEEGPWIFRVRPQLLDALLAVDPSDLRGIAETWARTGMMASMTSTGDPDLMAKYVTEVHDLLIDAIDIMGMARDEGREVYSLVSL